MLQFCSSDNNLGVTLLLVAAIVVAVNSITWDVAAKHHVSINALIFYANLILWSTSIIVDSFCYLTGITGVCPSKKQRKKKESKQRALFAILLVSNLVIS